MVYKEAAKQLKTIRILKSYDHFLTNHHKNFVHSLHDFRQKRTALVVHYPLRFKRFIMQWK